MQSLGEMATWLPLPGAIPQFSARYVDGAMGFAVGWNVSFESLKLVVYKNLISLQTWYQAAITLCAEISAASVVIDFWSGARHISVAVWITLIIILVICLNIFAVVSIHGLAVFASSNNDNWTFSRFTARLSSVSQR